MTGPNAAGKGEVASHLSRRGYTYHSLSDVVRAEARRRGLTTSRENLVLTGNDLRRQGGPAVLVERLVPGLALPAIVDSIRNPAEVEALQQLESFFLLGVTAPAAIRFRRIQDRGRLGDISNLDEFRLFEAKENSTAAGEQRIGATLELADATISNNSGLEELFQQVEQTLDRGLS